MAQIGEIPRQSSPLLEGEQKGVLELVGSATEIELELRA